MLFGQNIARQCHVVKSLIVIIAINVLIKTHGTNDRPGQIVQTQYRK